MRPWIRPRSPPAESLRQRVGVPWPVVVACALAPAGERRRVLVPYIKAPDRPFVREVALAGMRAAHLASGSASAVAYDQYLAELPKGHAERLGLPTASTIAANLGSWIEACAQAGTITAPPAPRVRRARPAVETLDELISETGLLPRRGYFEDRCRAYDIPVGREVRRWPELVAEVRTRRAARGDTTPDEATPARDWPPLPTSSPTRMGRRMVRGYSHADAIGSLRRFLQVHWRSGERITERRYKAACALDPELLPASTMARHGRFQDLIAHAQAGPSAE